MAIEERQKVHQAIEREVNRSLNRRLELEGGEIYYYDYDVEETGKLAIPRRHGQRDAFEERIFHLVESGSIQKAFKLVHPLNLSVRQEGGFDRLTRILRLFVVEETTSKIEPNPLLSTDQKNYLLDWLVFVEARQGRFRDVSTNGELPLDAKGKLAMLTGAILNTFEESSRRFSSARNSVSATASIEHQKEAAAEFIVGFVHFSDTSIALGNVACFFKSVGNLARMPATAQVLRWIGTPNNSPTSHRSDVDLIAEGDHVTIDSALHDVERDMVLGRRDLDVRIEDVAKRLKRFPADTIATGNLILVSAESRYFRLKSGDLPYSKLPEITNLIDEGLGMARRHGFGRMHWRLLQIRAGIHFILGDPNSCRDDAMRAAFGTNHSPADHDIYESEPRRERDDPTCRGIYPAHSSLPPLLASAHPHAGFFFETALSKLLVAKSYLLEAALALEADEFDPTNISRDGNCLENAKTGLLKLRDELAEVDAQRDPDFCKNPIPMLVEVDDILGNLEQGKLPPVSEFTWACVKQRQTKEADKSNEEFNEFFQLEEEKPMEVPEMEELQKTLKQLLAKSPAQYLALMSHVNVLRTGASSGKPVSLDEAIEEVLTKVHNDDESVFKSIEKNYREAKAAEDTDSSVYYQYQSKKQSNLKMPHGLEKALTKSTWRRYRDAAVMFVMGKKTGSGIKKEVNFATLGLEPE